MTARAHIRRGEIIAQYGSEKAKLLLEDGRRVLSATLGFVDGDDKVVPVEIDSIDNSTGTNTVQNDIITVEDDRVLITQTIRDQTAQEIDTELENEAVRLMGSANLKLAKMHMAGLFYAINEIRGLRGDSPVPVTVFLDQLDTLSDQIDDDVFKTKIKTLL